MKTKIIASLFALTLMTGCSSATNDAEDEGVAPISAGSTNTVNSLELNPVDSATFSNMVQGAMRAAINAVETERATNGALPSLLPEIGNEPEEVGTLKISDDGANYCLSFLHTGINAAQTYLSADGSFSEGENCSDFS